MDETLKTAFETGVGSIKTDVIDMMGVALPAGLAIMGVLLAVRTGVNFFRSLASA